MNTLNDQIERMIDITAPIERVFAAISQGDQLASWFCQSAEGDFSVGDQPVIDEGDYGRFRLAIVSNQPPTYFAFRWASSTPNGFTGDPLSVPNTLVEYFLSPTEIGTRLRVVESGFTGLPEAVAKKSFDDNCGGWDYMLPRIKRFVETGSAE